MLKLLGSTVRIVYRNAALSLLRVPKAALLFMVNYRNKQTHYVVICDHIGDFIMTMGYLEEYKKQRGKEHITVCTTPNLIQLLYSYQNAFDDYIEVSPKRLYGLLVLAATNFGTHVVRKLKNITLINPADAFVEDSFQYIMRYPHIRLKDCIQYGCLQLPNSAIFRPPIITDRGAAAAPIEGFKMGRTVLLCPYARAVSQDEVQLFERLSERLGRAGFVVLTNTSDSRQTPVKGTKGVTCTLIEVFSLAEKGGCVVGARSGLLDLLVYADCRLVAIYPKENEFFGFFNLSQMPGIRARIMQLKKSQDVLGDVKNIVAFLTGGNE